MEVQQAKPGVDEKWSCGSTGIFLVLLRRRSLRILFVGECGAEEEIDIFFIFFAEFMESLF